MKFTFGKLIRNWQSISQKYLREFRVSGCASNLNGHSVQNQNGMTLVEVMISILIFMIIMVGGLNYFSLPQILVLRHKTKRLAISAAQQKMEALAAVSFSQLTSALNESDTPVSLGTMTATRNTTITDIDDPADGLGLEDSDGDLVDYRIIAVEISWSDGNNKNVIFTTKVSKYGR